MRSVALLLAVAVGVSSAPLPHDESSAAKVPVKNLDIWQHKHYDSARQSVPVKRAAIPPPAAGYQHRHYETVATNEALRKRQFEHMARVRSQWDGRSYTVSSSIGTAQDDSSSTDAPSSTPTDAPSTVWTNMPSTTSTDASSTHSRHRHHGTRYSHSGAASTEAPGTYPTQAPCLKIPFPLPSSVESWTFTTSWVVPTGTPGQYKDWPFPWPLCPPEGQGSTDSSASSSSTDTAAPTSTAPTSDPTGSSSDSEPPVSTTTKSSDPAPEPTETSSESVPPESSTPTQSDPSPQPTSNGNNPSDPDAQAYLQAHNDARAQYHADALTWSDDLAALAKQWTSKCDFKHSGGSLSSDGYGENLAAGTGDYKPTDAVAGWMSEAPQYNSNNPQPSHFTQVVWKGSSEVGCAWSECAGGTIFDGKFGSSKFHSCMYRSPGNVIGNFPDNVQV